MSGGIILQIAFLRRFENLFLRNLVGTLHELPEIKSLSMEICDEEFNTTDSALTYIEVKVKEFYFDN